MSDNEKTRIEGAADQVSGKAKETAGNLTGNEQAQAEGKLDQLKGKAKEGLADAKDKVDGLMNNDNKSKS